MKVFSLATTRRLASIAVLASFVFSNVFAVYAIGGGDTKVVTKSPATAKYTTDLTQLGREGRLRENLSFEKETLRLVKVLAEGGVRQPVIVDEDKAVQDSVVEQVAIRIARGSVPANLKDKSILKLETATLFSNALSEADLAKIIDSIVNDAIASKRQIILYVDELTNLVGSKAAKTKLFDSITAGKLVIIGGSSAVAFDEHIEAQPEIGGFFAGILITDRSAPVTTADEKTNSENSQYRSYSISHDLREMMSQD